MLPDGAPYETCRAQRLRRGHAATRRARGFGDDGARAVAVSWSPAPCSSQARWGGLRCRRGGRVRRGGSLVRASGADPDELQPDDVADPRARRRLRDLHGGPRPGRARTLRRLARRGCRARAGRDTSATRPPRPSRASCSRSTGGARRRPGPVEPVLLLGPAVRQLGLPDEDVVVSPTSAAAGLDGAARARAGPRRRLGRARARPWSPQGGDAAGRSDPSGRGLDEPRRGLPQRPRCPAGADGRYNLGLSEWRDIEAAMGYAAVARSRADRPLRLVDGRSDRAADAPPLTPRRAHRGGCASTPRSSTGMRCCGTTAGSTTCLACRCSDRPAGWA